MSPLTLTVLSLALFALALLVAAGAMLAQGRQREAKANVVQRALNAQAAPDHATPQQPDFLNTPQWQRLWLDSRLGRLLVADEDRRLIAQAGLPNTRAEIGFLVSRIALSLLLPLLAQAALGARANNVVLVMAAGFAVGFMLPKWVLKQQAGKRKARVAHELPLFVDLLGLLQSVGLSLDQSLQVVASDFQHVLPVIGAEVVRANRQYAQGRGRDQAYRRMASLHDNQHLIDFVALMNQVDKHGGAVQEPIRQFGERLRLHRKANMKALVGKITVKMTVVMVATLLPALVIITAGPGFIAIVRSLGSMTGS